jgi:hypothetical protein
VEKVKGVKDETSDLLSKVQAFEGKVDAGGKQLSLDVLMNKTEEAVFFFNNVVATAVSSKGYFTVPDMSDMLAGKGAEFEAIKDFCRCVVNE